MPKKDTYNGMEITSDERAAIERYRAVKKLERSNAGKVMRRFAKMVKPLGFERKGTLFAREAHFFAHFISIHKYSFGPCFRLHCGIRVFNDGRDSVALNGLHESHGLEFSENLESLDQCAEKMFSLVTTKFEPWFRNQTPETLLENESCLYPKERDALKQAIDGQIDDAAVRRSRELLGFR